MKRLFISTVVGAVIAVMAPAVASAQSCPSASEYCGTSSGGLVEQISASRAPTLDEKSTMATSGVSTLDAAASRCKWHQAQRWLKSASGQVLYRYKQRITWCYVATKGKITLLSRKRIPEVTAPLWDWCCFVDTWGFGNVGSWMAQRGSSGKFQLCVGPWGIGCIQTRIPWVEQNVDAYGGVSFDTGG